MDPATISAVILAVATIVGLIVAYAQWRENHSDRKGGKLETKVKTILALDIKPTEDRLHDHTARLTQFGDRLNRIEDLLKDIGIQLRSFADTMSKMGVKVDMYWSTLESLAMNSAKGLHQPDPLRWHVDKLLEAFMEGTLTPAERLELKKILVDIRNFETKGTTSDENRQRAISLLGFPVLPGEQTYAAILLSTMDLVDPTRMAAMGHAAHRSAAHEGNSSG